MRKLGIVLGLCLLASCHLFSSRETKTRQLVEKELKSIDWNDVDQYPLFTDCDETLVKNAQKECFEQTLLLHFSGTLREFEFVLDNGFRDTIYVDFLVDNEGTLTVLEIEENAAIREQIPEFDGVITQSLKNLPGLEPALKRGIPVSTRFRIPLLLHSN